jgi:PBSX family phage terminase large subunit
MSSLLEFSPAQLQSLHEATARINIWVGAVRAGKTYISLWAFLDFVSHGPPGEYALITRTFDAYTRNILPLLIQIIGPGCRWFAGKRQMMLFGKTVHVIGCDDESAERKIRGPTFMGAYVDEMTIIPRSAFLMLVSRCTMHDAKIFATTNPDSPYHWAKVDYLDNNPDVKSWQFTLEDNPRLTSDEKAYLKRQYKGMWYERFILGRWVQAQGAIYDMYEEDLHCVDYVGHSAKQYIVGCDYGTTNACAFTLVGINPDRYPNMWVEHEYYYDSKIHQRQKTDAEYADDLAQFLEGRPVTAIYVDPSAASFKAELFKRGIDNVIDAENDVIDGIRFVAKLLCQGTLKICRHCRHLRREIQSYVWDERAARKGVERPVKENDHALDSLRYALYSHFGKCDARSLSGDELDRLYRETRGQGPQLPGPFQDPLPGLGPF